MSRILLSLLLISYVFVPFTYAQDSKDESKLNLQEQLISNLIDSSAVYRTIDLNQSIEICEKAIKLADRNELDSLMAFALKAQGVNYYHQRVYDSCMLYFNKALIKFEEFDNGVQVGKTLGNIGLIYKLRGEYTKAKEYYLKQISLYSKMNHKTGFSAIYINLGVLSKKIENWSRAVHYFKLGINAADEENNIGNKIILLNNVGAIYEIMGNFDEALSSYKESLKLVLNTGNRSTESHLYLNMGLIYRKIKDYTKAEFYLTKSFNIRKIRGDYDELLKVYNELFELAFARKEYKKAKQFIGTMRDLAEMDESKEWMSDVYRASYDLYKKTGQFKLALTSYENHKSIADSIRESYYAEKYNKLMLKYDMDQTKQEMILMSQESRIQGLEIDKKNAWLVAMIVVMLLGVIAIVVSFRINKLKAQHKLMSLDQKVLLSQMNPHFLFNALTAVQCLVLDNENDKANMYIADLASLVRNILEDSREESITLRKEIETLEKYIELQKLRFGFALNFRFEIDDKIDLDELNIPPMMTQPFIENALVHANLQYVNDPEILIKIDCINEDFVTFSIQDNGIGIEEGKKQPLMKDKKSLAMKIARERIQIFNYKLKHQMKLDIIDLKYIDENQQGTLARFTIPTRQV